MKYPIIPATRQDGDSESWFVSFVGDGMSWIDQAYMGSRVALVTLPKGTRGRAIDPDLDSER